MTRSRRGDEPEDGVPPVPPIPERPAPRVPEHDVPELGDDDVPEVRHDEVPETPDVPEIADERPAEIVGEL